MKKGDKTLCYQEAVRSIDGFVLVIFCSQQKVCNLKEESVVMHTDAAAATRASASSLQASVVYITTLSTAIEMPKQLPCVFSLMRGW